MIHFDPTIVRAWIADQFARVREIDLSGVRKSLGRIKGAVLFCAVLLLLVVSYIGGYVAGHRGVVAMRTSLNQSHNRVEQLRRDLNIANESLHAAAERIASLEKPETPAPAAKKAARKP